MINELIKYRNSRNYLRKNLYKLCYEFIELHNKEKQKELCEVILNQIKYSTNRNIRMIKILTQQDENDLLEEVRRTFSKMGISNAYKVLAQGYESSDFLLIDADEEEILPLDEYYTVIDHLNDFYETFSNLEVEEKDTIINWIIDN